MLTRLVIVLDNQERAALQVMAEREMRGLKDQARYLLREAASQRGLLPTKTTLEVTHDPKDDQKEVKR